MTLRTGLKYTGYILVTVLLAVVTYVVLVALGR